MERKALVVDNDFFFVEFMTELLEEQGYTVVKAYDGKEAMISLETGGVDIMFADIVMPKVDGWQLIGHVRRKYPERKFPVVAVSGTIIEQIDELDKIGADYYIAKGPIEKMKGQIQEFLTKIELTPFPEAEEKTLFQPGTIYPRKESMELIESLEYRDAVFDNIGLGLFVVDQDGRLIKLNRMGIGMLKGISTDFICKPIVRLFSKPDAVKLIARMKRVARDPAENPMSFSLCLGPRSMRALLSVLRVERKISGWILAMEDLEQWAEQVSKTS